ncbi:GlxA family transcriptional regulator [Sagittula sp. SSi028]|uniref:GlxA family transcriptional regulator n=1 Tax=Sagittula sp. SSi028 TaxID=3400636 RepID=UPI003AF6EB81
MQQWTTPPSDAQDVAVLLFPQFSNHCLANAIEPLRAVNTLLMREAYRWRFVTLDGGEVTSSSGLPVMPHGRLRDHTGGDLLCVVSSYGMRDLTDGDCARALRAASGRFARVAGMDTGAWLMAHAGLLDDRRATIHWDELTAFAEAFPAVDAVAERVVKDGNRLTCGGAMTAFDLVLGLIKSAHGAALAMEVSAYFLHQSTTAPQARVFRQNTSHLVERSIAAMSAQLETPLTIAEIAARMGVTQRSLSRAFHSDLGAAPKTVYKRLRLAAARRMAQQSSYPIAEIALRCGYGNAAAMTRAFVAEYGLPPSRFRSPESPR